MQIHARQFAVVSLSLLSMMSHLVGCDSAATNSNTPAQRSAHQIAHSSDVAAMRALITQGLDPDSRDRNGQTLLYVAVKGNQLEMVEYLLSAGAGVDLPTEGTGRTPLFQAAFDGFHEALDDMLDEDVDKDAAPMVALLIAHGADVNAKNRFDSTPIHDAVVGKNPHVVRVLLKHGANPATANSDGATPLDIAEESGLDEIAAILREHAQGTP